MIWGIFSREQREADQSKESLSDILSERQNSIKITAKNNWMENLERIYMKKINFKNVAYIASIYSFTFTQKKLKDSDCDKSSKKGE